jgi:hypothetical protein
MRLNLPTCSITINQNLQTNSNTPTDAINATSVGIAGGCQGPACPQARQVTGVPALADPLLGDYTAPTDPGGCTAVNDPATALTPGCYSKITTGSNKTLTFSQGVYYITGPVLIGNNNVVTNTGNGVLLYFAGTAATAANCTTTSTAGCIDVANNANVTLSAQTTGPYTALLMWQNSANLMNATFNGNNPTYNLKGAMYFPRANVSFNNGLNAANDCMLFVAWTLKLDNGNGNLSNVWRGLRRVAHPNGVDGGVTMAAPRAFARRQPGPRSSSSSCRCRCSSSSSSARPISRGAFYMSIELTNAARAGAQYGAYNQTQSSDTAKMRATATAAAPNISGMLPPVASRLCQCADDAGVFSPLAGGMTCLSPPAVSCPGLHRVMTVTVTTSATFSTIAGNVGIPGSLVITRTATLRVAEE